MLKKIRRIFTERMLDKKKEDIIMKIDDNLCPMIRKKWKVTSAFAFQHIPVGIGLR